MYLSKKFKVSFMWFNLCSYLKVTFSVQAGQPSRLYSAKNIPMPTVTNETNSASRIVVNKLVLEMQV